MLKKIYFSCQINLVRFFLFYLILYNFYSKLKSGLRKYYWCPQNCEIIMVLSNHAFFQYCDSDIGLFLFAPCKVITPNLLCYNFFAFSLYLPLYSYSSTIYPDSDSCHFFLLFIFRYRL